MANGPKTPGVLHQFYHEAQQKTAEGFRTAYDLMSPTQEESIPANSPKNIDNFLNEAKSELLQAAEVILPSAPASFKAFISTQKPDHKELAPAIIDLISEKVNGLRQGLQLFTQSEDEEDIVYGASVLIETAWVLFVGGALAEITRRASNYIDKRRHNADFKHIQIEAHYPLNTLTSPNLSHGERVAQAIKTRQHLLTLFGEEVFKEILRPETYSKIQKPPTPDLTQLAREIGAVDALTKNLEHLGYKIETQQVEFLAASILRRFGDDYLTESLLLDTEFTATYVIEQLAVDLDEGQSFEHSLHIPLLNAFERQYLHHRSTINPKELGIFWAYLRGDSASTPSTIPTEVTGDIPVTGKTRKVLAEALRLRQRSPRHARHDLNIYAAMANIPSKKLIRALSQPNANTNPLYGIPPAEWRAIAAIVQEAKTELTECLKGERGVNALIKSLETLQKDSIYRTLAQGDLLPEAFLNWLVIFAKNLKIDPDIINTGIERLKPQIEVIAETANSIPKLYGQEANMELYIDLFLALQQLRGPQALDLPTDLVVAMSMSNPMRILPSDFQDYFSFLPIIGVKEEQIGKLRTLARATAHIYYFREFNQDPQTYFDRIASLYNNEWKKRPPLQDILMGEKGKNFYRTQFPQKVAKALAELEKIRKEHPQAVEALEAAIAKTSPSFQLEAGNIADEIPKLVEDYQRKTLAKLSRAEENDSIENNPRAYLALIGRLGGISSDPLSQHKELYPMLLKSYDEFYEWFRDGVIPQYPEEMRDRLLIAVPQPDSIASHSLVNYARGEWLEREFNLYLKNENMLKPRQLFLSWTEYMVFLSHGHIFEEDRNAYEAYIRQNILEKFANAQYIETDMQLELTFGNHTRSFVIPPEKFTKLQQEAQRQLAHLSGKANGPNSFRPVPASLQTSMRLTRLGARH